MWGIIRVEVAVVVKVLGKTPCRFITVIFLLVVMICFYCRFCHCFVTPGNLHLHFFLQFSWQTDEGESVRADAPGTGCCVNPFGGRLTECSRSSRGGSRRMRWSEPFSVPFIFKAHNICVREGVFPQCDGGVKEMEVAEWMGGAGGGRG